MFKVNDYVVYGLTGVCQIIDIKKEKVGGSNQYYFELEKNIIKREQELSKEKKQEQNYNISNIETNHRNSQWMKIHVVLY